MTMHMLGPIMYSMTKHILILAVLALGACTTDDTDTTAKIGGAKGADIDQACGEMPWPEPGFTVTQNQTTTCMTNAQYDARDLYHQKLRDWAVCAEIQTCRNRGECQ